MKKPNIDWKTYGEKLMQGAKIYVTIGLVMVALVGTYGIYLWKNAPAAKPIQQEQAIAQTVSDQEMDQSELPAGEDQKGSDNAKPSPEETNTPASQQKQGDNSALKEQTNRAEATAKVTSNGRTQAKDQEVAAVPSAEAVPPLVADGANNQEVAVESEAVDQKDEQSSPDKNNQAVDPLLMPALASPCQGTISRKFGISYDPVYGDYRFHDGLDYSIQQAGDITAANQGTIGEINQSLEGKYSIRIIHQGHVTLYEGLDTIQVEKGQQVSKGQVVGHIDAGGQLHFGAEK